MNEERIKRLCQRLDIASDKIIELMYKLEAKSWETYQHSKRTSFLGVKLGKGCGLSQKELDEIALCGFLHDLGKIYVPEEIINKTSSLTKKEFDEIMKHSQSGYDMVKDFLPKSIALGVLQHHERVNGSGYPNGIKGKKITLYARIIALADAFDAITTPRNYHNAVSEQIALIELKNERNKYDVDIIEVLEKIVLDNEEKRRLFYA